MKQLMVISHDTYASGLTPATSDLDNLASLAVGAYAIIDKDPLSANIDKVVNIAATSEAETPARFIVVTMTASGLKFSPIIYKNALTAKYKAHVVPVVKVMAIGNHTALNDADTIVLPALEAGQVAGFMITDLTKMPYILTRNRMYTHDVITGDTLAIVMADLKAKVNADPNKAVTASDGYVTSFAGDGLKFTAPTAGNNFQVSTLGILRSAVISTVTANVIGTGTAAQVLEYERTCNIERGNPNYLVSRDNLFTVPTEVNLSTSYDTLILRFNTPTHRPILDSINPTQELELAFDSALTANGDGKSQEGVTNFVVDIG
jgi:hypothetical protein